MEKVGVVHKDLNWIFGTKEKVSLISQPEYESEEFVIPDIVVPFHAIKGLGCVSNCASFSSFIFLE
jgi:hypothetical protein